MDIQNTILSIDFGNSYCKVGLREGTKSQADLLSDDSFRDEGNFCIPTIIGQRISDGMFRFGTDALRENEDDMRVYRNWKPMFFEESEVASQDSLRASLSRDGHDVDELALGFFTWLRKQIEAVCRVEWEIENFSELPVRVTLPAFGNVAQATERLGDLLEESGWNLSPVQSAVGEPVANTVGAFSNGRNFVWKPDKNVAGEMLVVPGTDLSPHFGKMFKDSPFLQAYRAYAMGFDEEGPIHWVLVADLGGYTLDFAMLGFDREDLSQAFTPGATKGDLRLFERKSYSLGVMDLDQMVYDALPPDEREAMEQINRENDQSRLETFHRLFYKDYKPFRVRRTSIGATAIEPVHAAVDQFVAKIIENLDRFLDTHQYPGADQLVLTGGGSNIDKVREAMIKRLEPQHTHGARFSNRENPPENYHELPAKLVRGATAIGGTSVYFEF